MFWQINGTERRFVLNSQAELNNFKHFWSLPVQHILARTARASSAQMFPETDWGQPPQLSRVKLHSGTGRMWVVVSWRMKPSAPGCAQGADTLSLAAQRLLWFFYVSQDRIVAATDLSGFSSSNWKTPAWRQSSYTKILPADCFLNGSLCSK